MGQQQRVAEPVGALNMEKTKTQSEEARKIIKALLEAGEASAAASSTGNPAELKKAERATDGAITRAYKFMTGEAPPSDQDLVDFIYGDPE
jgi:hypothetical protein